MCIQQEAEYVATYVATYVYKNLFFIAVVDYLTELHSSNDQSTYL